MGLSFGRRARNVWEVVDFGKYNLISEWSPTDDTFSTCLGKSFLIDQIAIKKGLTKDDLVEEIKRREQKLEEVLKSGKRSQDDVTQAIIEYYNTARQEKLDKIPRITKPRLMPQIEAPSTSPAA
jgi:hypothetical protein